MKHKIVNILNQDDIAELKNLYNSLPANPMVQSHNLFHVDKRSCGADYHPVTAKVKEFIQSSHNTILKAVNPYFVMYESEAFTQLHTDFNTTMTCVTLVSDNDLVGGETLIMENYEPKDMPNAGIDGDDKIFPNMSTPCIVNLKPGDTLIYGPSLPHGVAKVISGSRLVLVQWFVSGNCNPLQDNNGKDPTSF